MLDDSRKPYRYLWPQSSLRDDSHWRLRDGDRFYARSTRETTEQVSADSRWPAFFPAPICSLTSAHGSQVSLEKEGGASIVNRFPLVMALNHCKRALLARQHARQVFTRMLETSGEITAQFLALGRTPRRMRALCMHPKRGGVPVDFKHGAEMLSVLEQQVESVRLRIHSDAFIPEFTILEERRQAHLLLSLADTPGGRSQ